MSKGILRSWQLWLGVVISLFFLYWAFKQISSFGGVLAALAAAEYLWVLPAVAVYFVGVWFRALRWQSLLAPLKKLPAPGLFRVTVIGYMANDVLPLRMGELVRAYVLFREQGVSKSAALATILLERLFDGITLLLFAVIVSFAAPVEGQVQYIVRVAAVIFALGIGIFLAMAIWPVQANRAIGLLLRFLPAGLRSRTGSIVASFIAGLQALQRGHLLLNVVAFSALAWLCESTVYFLIGLGFTLFQPFQVFVLTAVVDNIGTMVPSSPGYVGTFEALSVLTLGFFKVNADLAMSYTLALHVVLLVPVTLLGFFYLWRDHISLAVLSKQRVEPRTMAPQAGLEERGQP